MGLVLVDRWTQQLVQTQIRRCMRRLRLLLSSLGNTKHLDQPWTCLPRYTAR